MSTPPLCDLTIQPTEGAKRIEWIDIAKGIGIVLVVMGHMQIMGRFIYSFHMPMFFMLSGMCFHPEKYPQFVPFLKRRINQLLIPLLLFNVIVLVARSLCFGFHDALQRSCQEYKFQEKAQWFLFILFWSEVVFYGIWRGTSGRRNGMLLSLVIVYIIADLLNVYSIELPFHLAAVPCCLFFYGLGNVFATTIHRYVNHWNVCLGLLLLLVNAVNVHFNGNCINLAHAKLGVPSAYYVAFALMSSIAMYIVSYHVPGAWIRAVFMWLGRNTLVILCVHETIIELSDIYVQPLCPSWVVYRAVETILVTVGSLSCVAIVNYCAPVLSGKGQLIK
jgi:fucose 4-O-acetylase-like acetyltransferase